MHGTKDAYQRAHAINDQATIDRWDRFSSKLDEPLVIISPDPFLQYVPGYKQGAYPTQAAFDDSQAVIITLLNGAVAEANGEDSLRSVIEPYLPPSGYQRAGMGLISTVNQVVQWVQDNPTASFVAGYYAEKTLDKVPVRTIVKALPLFGQHLVNWWDSIGVPSYERRMPVLSPALLLDACELHAQVVLGHPNASAIQIVPAFAINADYECFKDAFSITVAFPDGMLIYALTNRARVVSISLYDATGIQEIDVELWKKAYPATTP